MKGLSYNKAEKLVLYAPMLIYFAFMIILLILRTYPVYWLTGNPYYNPVYPTRSYNLTPFHTLAFYMNEHRKSYLDVFGNAAIFMPMGIYCQLLMSHKKIWKSATLLIGIVLFIETTQYILSTGAFDIDDILLNTVGGVVGIGIYKAIFVMCKRNENQTRYIISVASIIAVPFILFLALQYINWFHPIRYAVGSSLLAIMWDLLFYKLYLNKESHNKAIYWIIAVLMMLMYLIFALPQVSPSHY